jgi:hypothetical protein
MRMTTHTYQTVLPEFARREVLSLLDPLGP